MKKKHRFLLFLFAGFMLGVPAGAQTSPDISIHVMDVSGTGSSPGDNAFITGLLTDEVKRRNYLAPVFPYGSDFVLIGTLRPYVNEQDRDDHVIWYTDDTWIDEGTVFDDNLPSGEETAPGEVDHPFYYVQMYVFHLALKTADTDVILAEQDLMYYSQDDFVCLFPILITRVFSQPLTKKAPDDWRNKTLYLGVSGFWSPRIYYGTEQETHFANFGIGITLEWQFLKFMSAGIGLEFTPEWVVASDVPGDNYRDLAFEIPIALKGVIKLSDHYMLEPYGGIHVNVPVYNVLNPALFSWMVGFQYGVKAGQGVFFINPRFSMDIGTSHLVSRGSDVPDYTRYMIHLGIGYKYGFISKQ